MDAVRPPAVSSSSSASSTRSGLFRSVAAKFARGRKGAQPPKDHDAKSAKIPQEQKQEYLDAKSAKIPQEQKQEYLDEYTTASVLFSKAAPPEDALKIKQLQPQQQQLVFQGGGKDEEEDQQRREKELATLLASIFARVSAIKAAYAEIQVAQAPYDPATIQAADVSVVDQLRRISQLKQGYLQNNNFLLKDLDGAAAPSVTEAELLEKKNLLKTYETTAKKLELELGVKDRQADELKGMLDGIDNKTKALEHRLRHPRQQLNCSASSSSPTTATTLSNLDGLHLSGLDPTHFLLALRYAVRGVKDFVGVLLREMGKAQWDLSLAAAAIAPCALTDDDAPPEARDFAFQSYVCLTMFSDFHLGPGFAEPVAESDDKAASASTTLSERRRQCFEEFAAGRSCTSAKDLARLRRPFAEFCRTKYAAVVRPQMETAFFAGMDRRAMADADLFVSFAEMSRRVWLLHWLFCSFEPEARVSVFRVEPGSRFSEVYMDSLGAASPHAAEVGFTVVPGFRLRGMLIQSKVYLGGGNRRSSPPVAAVIQR